MHALSTTDPKSTLSARVQEAIEVAFGAEYAGTDAVIRPSQFADYQANAALPLAKRLGRKPREVAADIVAALQVDDLCAGLEISGPGFINLTLRDEAIADRSNAQSADPRLGLPVLTAQRIVVDYSAPNVAKEMHVGHLRTTVVGDALARTLEHLGHQVIRQNHIGDWGTPFGMLLEHLLDVGEHGDDAGLLRSDPNSFYQSARNKFEGSTEFAGRARARVVALQAGEPNTLRLWQELIDLSKTYFNQIYTALDVTLTDDDLMGESRYNESLSALCDELEQKGLAVVSEGALCVFLEGFTGREGKPVPLIIRKSDGGYGYGTTDLATIRYRARQLHADRILYVIGAPQHLHLQMVFATARLAGWLPEDVHPVHVQIGNVLGQDGKILKTRSGAPIRLGVLLEEAVDRAAAVVEKIRPDLDDRTRADIARQVGIGAVKYADLSLAHDTEYTFDFDRMLALTGNTGPYLQYASARIRSILRKATDTSDQDAFPGTIEVGQPAERRLALELLGFGGVVAEVGDTLEPHRLCAYLFSLAQAFTGFYDACPVLKAPDPAVRSSRLALCDLTLRVLVVGLGLLGVSAPEQM
ncbi:arginine--tRNA ligase [Nakamurella sp. PAMC28650]|uniref:arginine--tRNA ligase n=1 Tax=Nakamurella sp. PAMC28650 TaxID=2762325 RepID=UPI00164DABF1|nr:arginine--tRNA ligase [Nakamurella sp. PAMC28650]QNK79736.1 arginine--tRNA ligase [Nakamurella sp. PAMC28650]